MKQLRRIETKPSNAYATAQRQPLRNLDLLSEAQFWALERDRPGLVIVDGDAVLIGWPRSNAVYLLYGYPDHSSFSQRFPSMLQQLLDAVDPAEAPVGLRLRLYERSARVFVEPVLFANAFEIRREFWRMTLDKLPASAALSDEVVAGFLLRKARPEDAEAIAELDSLSFVQPWLTPASARELIVGAPLMRVLEEASTGRAIGFLGLRRETLETGYVSDLAVHPDYQRRGLGEALMRWSVAWFRSQGLRRAALQVNTDNAPAIALYRKLGFVAGDIGLDYRRPVDQEEVQQVLEKRRAAHITVRRRY